MARSITIQRRIIVAGIAASWSIAVAARAAQETPVSVSGEGALQLGPAARSSAIEDAQEAIVLDRLEELAPSRDFSIFTPLLRKPRRRFPILQTATGNEDGRLDARRDRRTTARPEIETGNRGRRTGAEFRDTADHCYRAGTAYPRIARRPRETGNHRKETSGGLEANPVRDRFAGGTARKNPSGEVGTVHHRAAGVFGDARARFARGHCRACSGYHAH